MIIIIIVHTSQEDNSFPLFHILNARSVAGTMALTDNWLQWGLTEYYNYTNLYYTFIIWCYGNKLYAYKFKRRARGCCVCSRPVRRTGRSVDRASNRDPQIPAQSMDSCAKYGSTDCAARSMDCADPHIAPNTFTVLLLC